MIAKPPALGAISHSPELLVLLRELFTDEGYRVVAQATPDCDIDALAAAEPAVVILDCAWAARDDDVALLAAMGRQPLLAGVPVILIVSVPEPGMSDAPEHGQTIQVVRKPFDIDHLLAAVGQARSCSSTTPA